MEGREVGITVGWLVGKDEGCVLGTAVIHEVFVVVRYIARKRIKKRFIYSKYCIESV